MEGYATGVNIVNTADETQVIKFRFRRATDSMDALDFNVVLSPYDMYTGFISMSGDDITWTSNDNSCTAPAYNVGDNKFAMPDIYREDAETGYIEIISMGSVDETTGSQALAVAAKHDSTGMPADCDAVRDNFFAGGVSNSKKGVVSSSATVGPNIAVEGAPLATTNYVASSDSLKVSFFIKSDATGTEFGDNAVHIEGFLDTPSITNQQTGIFSNDLQGFDYPDLNGGAPTNPASRGKFNALREALAASKLVNDWSANVAGDFSVDTDWVVTYPGQYVQLDLAAYIPMTIYGAGNEDLCLRAGETADPELGEVPNCDFRDIPVTASITVYDREEQEVTVEEGELVVSPSPPVITPKITLDNEVNVIQWGGAPVLNAPVAITGLDVPAGASFGWASLVGSPSANNDRLCDWDLAALAQLEDDPEANVDPYVCVEDPAPVGDVVFTNTAPAVGFVAWQRNFGANPDANYGRIVEHSRSQPAS
ncbi:hypothetical protein DWB85_00605 [Seongchinamella sediminis]|uniref:Uncharacterized protein n=2 Tax=Seongchinamella sediminis TaxID=2283635 RepID=A0A3L7E494_9GAMM|nr:hypothetical protein DWB85_00605 [Seongchinamella sediminis]